MTDWQLISTAPKDGTRVLVAMPSGVVTISFWAQDHWWSPFSGRHERQQPTHWMPLPNPPKDAP